MSKRKAEDQLQQPAAKRAVSNIKTAISHDFRKGLFAQSCLDTYKTRYSESSPYKHGVIQDLISPPLLRSVRTEIRDNVHFTPKETDIYKIHQSGDLANLDGLDDTLLKLLPSLLQLRDALYSGAFREYLSEITGAGPLSGRKTDMAINVYTPGCHLLCHDDVIGSRRVSYILYLTDPDQPWQEEWGGALRLYPTTLRKSGNGEEVKVPSQDSSVSIPPAFNQLSFFAVQPGESFHDVEEVYSSGSKKEDEKRVRMAISGWYHIPQEGEEGYEEGLEEKLAKKSSLLQLQSHACDFDLPASKLRTYDELQRPPDKLSAVPEEVVQPNDDDDDELSVEDLDFLLRYVHPKYLTPDALFTVFEEFGDVSSLTMSDFLSPKFCESLQKYVLSQESDSLPNTSKEVEAQTAWRVALPPHKHRYLFQQPLDFLNSQEDVGKGKGKIKDDHAQITNPVSSLLNDLLPSQPFRKWLRLATGQRVLTYDVMARRFRRGKDYTLATGYEAEEPRLEMILSITPPAAAQKLDHLNEAQPGAHEDEADKAEGKQASQESMEAKGKGKGKAKDRDPSPDAQEESKTSEEDGTGGYVAYMAPDNSTAANVDPAIYKSSSSAAETGDEDDSGILFSVPHPSWNTLSLVLRDQGVMRFVKYLGKDSKTDRWDLVGEFQVEDEVQVWDDDDKENQGETVVGADEEEESTEVEFDEEEDETEVSE